MNKKHFLFPIIGVLSIGLAGCGNNESAVQDRNTERVQPFGYYSNESHNNGGNVRILDDNDGPITEMMDHSLGTEGTNERNGRQQILETRDENGNPGNPTRPLATTDRNFFERDNRFSKSDMNYHGHLDSDRARINNANGKNQARIQGTNENFNAGNRARIQGTNPAAEVNLTNKLNQTVKSVKNVQDVQTIVNGNNVIIAVDLVDKGAEAETRQKIQQAVKTYANGRDITVVTEQGSFKRVRDLNQNSGFRDEYDQELRKIIQNNAANQQR